MSGGHAEGAAALAHDDDHEEHEEHVNHEAWVIPYADLLTLLMALFIVLWATSVQSEEKFAAVAESLREAFNHGTGISSNSQTDGTNGVLEGKQTGVENGDFDEAKTEVDTTVPIVKPEEAVAREQAREAAAAAQAAQFAEIQRNITEHAAAAGMAESITFRTEKRGLVVSIVTDNVLFDSGAAALKPQGQNILSVVAAPLKLATQDIMVEGHTDNSPINTSRYPTNWELSSDRGTSVLRNLVEQQAFPANRIASAGYGDTRPVAANDSIENKAANRRVEIVVLAG